MRLTLKALYDLSVTTKMPVLGHDGLPIGSVIVSDAYYFTHKDDVTFDFTEFYEKCVYSGCRHDMVAGECKFHEYDGHHWIGVDLFVLEDDEIKSLTFQNS